jgi:hypothetical protein
MARRRGEGERLTIRLGGKDGTVPIGSFLFTIQRALGVLKEIDRELSESGQPELRWRIVAARMQSPLEMTIEGVPKVGSERRVHPRKVVDSYLKGLSVLKRSAIAPPVFSDAALEGTKSLTSVVNDGLSVLEFRGSGKTKLVADQRLVDNVEDVLKTRYYYEHATLDGRLEVVDIHATPKFSIFHELDDHKTVCDMPAERIDEAISLFGKRVAVRGLVKFNRQGKPLRIKVEELRRLRDSAELPKFKDVEGIRFTGGEASTEYMRKLRDGRKKD